MAKCEKHRIKILRVYEYLKKYSDEDKPRSVHEIIEALEAEGIKCERSSFAAAMRWLVDRFFGT